MLGTVVDTGMPYSRCNGDADGLSGDYGYSSGMMVLLHTGLNPCNERDRRAVAKTHSALSLLIHHQSPKGTQTQLRTTIVTAYDVQGVYVPMERMQSDEDIVPRYRLGNSGVMRSGPYHTGYWN